jgi:hypothetical protein
VIIALRVLAQRDAAQHVGSRDPRMHAERDDSVTDPLLVIGDLTDRLRGFNELLSLA